MRNSDCIPLLSLKGLNVAPLNDLGRGALLSNVSFDIFRGETLCLVGESGSGKTLTALAIMSLLPAGLQKSAGECIFEQKDIFRLSATERQRIYGRDIAIIFQDPMSSLNPVLKVGEQIDESLSRHQPALTSRQRLARAKQVLSMTGIDDPHKLQAYPHELSGGLCQRIMIAIALANKPSVIIADEPTTALDVTVQAQVMDTLQTACRETGTALVLITHDMGLVGQYADRVMVMYAGKLVEQGNTAAIFQHPLHPYTRALLDCVPRLSDDPERPLLILPGEPHGFYGDRQGCAFISRCLKCNARQICQTEAPRLSASENGGTHHAACHFMNEALASSPAITS
ncbi:ABC transporter ATP-binding protein [Rahnella sp. L72c]|uniref:ABC transporter ATP-binding protein n=1 Tax=Rahnella perminowiae TaxID=2816244 RepID=A0ABS6KVQ7_9GAMM|nr:ABC transporter ATP-binding protein [Rahnella perminowiae]MBU9833579.1 ABC transporter ATP-binding protein [Rahnella perminowiae]